MNEEFSMEFSNGCRLLVAKPVNKTQKSWSLLFNTGKDNIYRQVGIIRDVEFLREHLGDLV